MSEPQPTAPGSARRGFPRVPAYAWSWLQRSRAVLHALAHRLTGGPPGPGFIDEVRGRFEDDPFVRDVVIDVICDAAFGGRVPTRRPPGANWDRGLTWWAASIAGVPQATFEAPEPPAPQRVLFAHDDAPSSRASIPTPLPQSARWGTVSAERAMLVASLRGLLAAADGDQVPADAVRQLLAQLESD